MRVCPFKTVNFAPRKTFIIRTLDNQYITKQIYLIKTSNMIFWSWSNVLWRKHFLIYIWTFYNTDLVILRKLFYSKKWLQVSSHPNYCFLNPNFEFSASRMTNLTIWKLSALFVWSSDFVYVQRYGACADLEIFRGISGGIVLLPWGPRPIFGNEYKLNRIKQVQLTHKIN